MRFAARVLPAATLLAALGIAAGCGRQPAAESRPAPRQSLAPAERGRLRAGGDLAAGRLRVYRYGNPASFTNPRTDPESGLPLRTLLDCCVTAADREETEAYNQFMRTAAREREAARLRQAEPPGRPPSGGGTGR